MPLVNSAAEAAAAVDACRYPPLGHRSWGPVRASLRQPGYAPDTANADVLCIPMIETVDAVEVVEEICAVPGVDALFVGPWDLSLSATNTIETPGRKPVDQELIARVAAAARAHGVHLGIACSSAEEAGARSEQGFALLALLSDVALLGRAATDVAASRAPAPRRRRRSARVVGVLARGLGHGLDRARRGVEHLARRAQDVAAARRGDLEAAAGRVARLLRASPPPARAR